jgi:hypothetical protein
MLSAISGVNMVQAEYGYRLSLYSIRNVSWLENWVAKLSTKTEFCNYTKPWGNPITGNTLPVLKHKSSPRRNIGGECLFLVANLVHAVQNNGPFGFNYNHRPSGVSLPTSYMCNLKRTAFWVYVTYNVLLNSDPLQFPQILHVFICSS